MEPLAGFPDFSKDTFLERLRVKERLAQSVAIGQCAYILIRSHPGYGRAKTSVQTARDSRAGVYLTKCIHTPYAPWVSVSATAALLWCLVRGQSLGNDILRRGLLEIAVIAAFWALVTKFKNREDSPNYEVSDTDSALDPVTAGVLGLESEIPRRLTNSEHGEVIRTLTSVYSKVGQQAYASGMSRDPYKHPDVVEAVSAFPFGDVRTQSVLGAYRQGYCSAQGSW